MQILLALALNALALLATAYVVPGLKVDTFTSALLAAVVIGVINTFVKPILSYLTKPINMLTLGLFSFVINAVVLYLATFFVPGFRLDGVVPAVLGAVVLAVVATVLSSLVKEVKRVV